MQGLRLWTDEGDYSPPRSGLLLLKLHGSVDWRWVDSPREKKLMPFREVESVREDEIRAPRFSPAVVFGQRNKLTADGPFLDILRAFERELKRADRVDSGRILVSRRSHQPLPG